jgi:hypothetical protein
VIRVDYVPVLARPEEINGALAEVSTLTARVSEASEAAVLAARQHEQAEHEDVEMSAARVVSGETVGAAPTSLRKTKQHVEESIGQVNIAKRAHQLANDAAEAQIRKRAEAWLAAIDGEGEQARTQARVLLLERLARLGTPHLNVRRRRGGRLAQHHADRTRLGRVVDDAQGMQIQSTKRSVKTRSPPGPTGV